MAGDDEPAGKRNYFGAEVAARYDTPGSDMFAPAVVEPTVELLARLAGGGPALELGIGTGRIALPLSERGIEVAGIDLSEAMVARLRAKPGGDRVRVVIGDVTSARVEGRFRLVYLVFNTIMNLTTQEEQVACFVNAAAHLEPGGCFLIEVMVPELQRLPPGESLRVFERSGSHVGIDEYDVAGQGLVSHHYVVLDGGGVDVRSYPFRYVWPAELDLMARLAGLSLRHRFGGWSGEPFTSESRSHVSVWAKPGTPA
jgi:SAM-dependent methyltransferase